MFLKKKKRNEISEFDIYEDGFVNVLHFVYKGHDYQITGRKREYRIRATVKDYPTDFGGCPAMITKKCVIPEEVVTNIMNAVYDSGIIETLKWVETTGYDDLECYPPNPIMLHMEGCWFEDHYGFNYRGIRDESVRKVLDGLLVSIYILLNEVLYEFV